MKGGPASAIVKTWQTNQLETNLVSIALHARYDRENLRAGRRRVAEKALLGKVRSERQLVWVLSWLLNDRCGWEAQKARYIPRHPKPIQFNAMNAHKGAGIPPQYHPRLLLRPGGVCANSIGHGKKRNDMQSAARNRLRIFAMEYRL